MKYTIYTLFAAMLLLLGGQSLMAQEEMSEEEMMKAWAVAMTPNAEHKWMAELNGDWTYEQTTWMDPTKGPEVSQGKATKTMTLGGRYLRETFSGTSMGMPFQGESTTAYNTITGKYYTSWIDNMGTGFMTGEGTREGNTLNIASEAPAMDGKTMDKFRSVMEIVSKDQHNFVMYMYDKDGKEMKFMEIVYTRK